MRATASAAGRAQWEPRVHGVVYKDSPLEELGALQGNDGQVKQFCVHAVPYSYEYPRAHTCFNRLDLPRYRTAEELERYLRLVLQMELTGFGMQ